MTSKKTIQEIPVPNFFTLKKWNFYGKTSYVSIIMPSFKIDKRKLVQKRKNEYLDIRILELLYNRIQNMLIFVYYPDNRTQG